METRGYIDPGRHLEKQTHQPPPKNQFLTRPKSLVLLTSKTVGQHNSRKQIMDRAPKYACFAGHWDI